MRGATDRASCLDAGRIPIERGTDIRRLVAELAARHRFGVDVCIWEHTGTGPYSFFETRESAPVYVGRLGLTDSAGNPLLEDLRALAVEPFFAASLADPRGVSHRGRYRWLWRDADALPSFLFHPRRRATEPSTATPNEHRLSHRGSITSTLNAATAHLEASKRSAACNHPGGREHLEVGEQHV